MKRILMLFVTVFPLLANAQRVDKPGEPYEYYCFASAEAQKEGKWNISGFKVTLNLCGENGCLLDKDGQEILFNDSWKELYTYMSKRGWTFVSRDGSLILFKKNVTSDEQVKEGLNIRIEKEWDSPVKNEQ